MGWSSSPPAERPSIVVISAPSACTVSSVQLLTDSPFTWQVQAPQLVVSHPTCEPVRPRGSRRKCTSSNRGSTEASRGSPLTVRRTGTVLPMLLLLSSKERLGAEATTEAEEEE